MCSRWTARIATATEVTGLRGRHIAAQAVGTGRGVVVLRPSHQARPGLLQKYLLELQRVSESQGERQ